MSNFESPRHNDVTEVADRCSEEVVFNYTRGRANILNDHEYTVYVLNVIFEGVEVCGNIIHMNETS